MDKKKRQQAKSVLRIAAQGIKKWGSQPRMYMVLFSIIVFLWTQVQDVRGYAAAQGLGVSCWFFPFLFSHTICAVFLYIGLILVYCNAPFVDRQQMFVMLRSGKRTWFLGQLLYVVLASAIYFSVVALFSMAEFLPHLGLSADWGTVLRQAVQYPDQTGVYLSIKKRTLEAFSPLRGFCLVFLVNVGVGIFIGQLVFLVNLYKSRAYGSVAALGVVILADLIWYEGGPFKNWIKYISPVSWTSLNFYGMKNDGISIGYVGCVLVILNLVLAFLIMRRSKHYSIEALEEF